MNKSLLALACVLLAALPARGDLVTPGMRNIHHELVLDASPALEGWMLVATPVRGFGGATVIEPGVPFDFSTKYGTRVYAFPAGSAPPSEPEAVREAAQVWGVIPVREVSAVPLASPVARVVTTLRAISIDANGVVLEVVGERRIDITGSEDGRGVLGIVLAGTAACGLLGILLVRRRRRAG